MPGRPGISSKTVIVRYQDLVEGFRSLQIDPEAPVIAHASLSSFGNVRGGARTVVGALLGTFNAVMMPTFTYKTMVVPDTGPPNNGLQYGRSRETNRLAIPFTPGMPADRLMGAVPEALRTHRLARRSDHPILSFAGVGVADLLADQPVDDPLRPIRGLVEQGGWVLLLGVDLSVNTTIHEAERLAGRMTFIRWALQDREVKACAGFPGCSNGFVDLEPVVAGIGREVRIGPARVRAFPAPQMTAAICAAFLQKPWGYLCKRMDCGRCSAIRTVSAL